MSTFTWTPDFGASKKSKPSVTQVKFGDGYEQRIVQGLNTNPAMWDVKFSLREDDESNEIIDFLEARGASESFDWTPPLSDTEYKFVCREWGMSTDYHNKNTITAVFEQVFEP